MIYGNSCNHSDVSLPGDLIVNAEAKELCSLPLLESVGGKAEGMKCGAVCP